jgi:hypothetical protein
MKISITKFEITSILFHIVDCLTDDLCVKTDKEIEDCVLRILTDAALSLPSDSRVISRNVSSLIGNSVSHTVVSNLLQKFAAQELIRYRE